MQKSILVLGLIIVMLGLPGCQASSKPLDQAKKPDTQVNPAPDVGNYPSEVYSWLTNMREYEVAGVVEKGDKTYLLVSGGDKPTTGYQVKIEQVQERDEAITVMVDLVSPPGPAAQVISYPNAAHTLNHRLGNKRVEFYWSSNQEPIPQVIGDQPTIPFEAASNNIKIMSMDMDNQRISARGIARVFEGSLNYEFVNSTDETVKSGVIQTRAGAPDWGSFVLDDIPCPSEATKLQLFWINPKNGEPQDMITIPL
ncbi:MAG TPA: protease complex subunit PrcB family protein [Syntrophomonadaceae bacterium]|nr:protease complex subunit PrcB family protein [Syntrophomonadaceae bacterium]HQD90346.1 protease complex subunit PrcB family protein [Syntrophomonadaceae bacterium]